MDIQEAEPRDETGAAEDPVAPMLEEEGYSSDDFEEDARNVDHGEDDSTDEAPEDSSSELTTLQEACARMVQDLQALRDETSALRGPVHTGKDGARTDEGKEKQKPSQSVTVGKGLEAAINAVRVRHPSAIIFSGGSRKPQDQPRKAAPCPEGREGGEGKVRLEVCSQRKRPQCFSFGPPRTTVKDNRPPHAPPACPSVKRKRACPSPGPVTTQEHVTNPVPGPCDTCDLCDDSCWWGCGCLCHEGCAIEEQDGRRSPVKSQAPKAEGPVGKGARGSGFSFGKAPRTMDGRTTAATAVDVMDTSGALKYIKPRVKGGAWVKPTANIPPDKQGAPAPVAKPHTEQPTRPLEEDAMIITEAQGTHELSQEAPQPVREEAQRQALPCNTNADAMLSTRSRAPCVVMAPPPCAKVKANVGPYRPLPGPGQYDVHDVFGGFRGVKMAAANTDHQHSIAFELMMARRQVERQVGGPGYYNAQEAFDALRPRPPSLRLFAAPPPRKERDTDVMEIEENAGLDAEEEARPEAESKSKAVKARSHACKGLKDWDDDEWSSDNDRKGSASTLSCYESKWTDSEDEGKEDKQTRRRRKPPPTTAAAPKKPADAQGRENGPTGAEPGRFVGPRVRGFRMVSDTGAGLSWRNRVAVARAREERDRPRRLFGYDVKRDVVDRRVAGGASFAAQASAQEREERRRERHGGLAEKKALEARCLAVRADFLGPQLCHAWVAEEEGSRMLGREEGEGVRREGHRAVMESVRAFGKARQRAAKPVPRYRPEAELEQRAALARATREAAHRRTQDAWLQPQLQSQWGDKLPGTTSEGAPAFDKRPGRETLRVRRKGMAEVADFNAPIARNTDPMGPGFYDVAAGGLAEKAAGGPDFDKMRSREESRGPFGERAAAEEREAREAGEGDCLILAPDKNVVKKRVKAFSFSKLGEKGPTKAEQGPREGDILELDLDRRPGEERTGGRLVAWSKVQGREDNRGGGGEDDDGHHGDVLILEPQPDVREKRVVTRSFGKTDRWQQAPAKEDQSEELILDDSLLASKATIKAGPSMAKQAGRWAKQEEEEALRRQSRRDEADGAKFEIERDMEADAAIRRAQEYLGGRGVARAGLSMGIPPPQEPTIRKKTADDTEITASALQAERERAAAVEKAQQNALSSKTKRVTGFSMGKQNGRPSDAEAAAASEEFLAKDGEVLILSPRAEASSRYKRKPGKGVLTWNRMVEQFSAPTHVAAPAQADHGPSSPKLPVSLLSRVASFASQPDRPMLQASLDKTDAPDGQRLILSPRYQRPRVTGGASMGPAATKADRQSLSKARGSTESLNPSAPAARRAGKLGDDQSVKDGEVLILSPRAEASSSRKKPGQGVLTWNRMVERFASFTQTTRATPSGTSDRPSVQALSDDERADAPDGQRLILSPRYQAPRVTGGAAMKQNTTEPRVRPTPAPKTERRPLTKARGSADSLDISLGSSVSLLGEPIQAPRVTPPPPAAPTALKEERSTEARAGTNATGGKEVHKAETRQEVQTQPSDKAAVSAPAGAGAVGTELSADKPLSSADAGKEEHVQATISSGGSSGGGSSGGGVEGGAVSDLLQQLWDLEI